MPTVKFDLQEAGMAPMKEGKMIAIGSPAQQEAWSIVDAKDPFVPPLHWQDTELWMSTKTSIPEADWAEHCANVLEILKRGSGFVHGIICGTPICTTSFAERRTPKAKPGPQVRVPPEPKSQFGEPPADPRVVAAKAVGVPHAVQGRDASRTPRASTVLGTPRIPGPPRVTPPGARAPPGPAPIQSRSSSPAVHSTPDSKQRAKEAADLKVVQADLLATRNKKNAEAAGAAALSKAKASGSIGNRVSATVKAAATGDAPAPEQTRRWAGKAETGQETAGRQWAAKVEKRASSNTAAARSNSTQSSAPSSSSVPAPSSSSVPITSSSVPEVKKEKISRQDSLSGHTISISCKAYTKCSLCRERERTSMSERGISSWQTSLALDVLWLRPVRAIPTYSNHVKPQRFS